RITTLATLTTLLFSTMAFAQNPQDMTAGQCVPPGQQGGVALPPGPPITPVAPPVQLSPEEKRELGDIQTDFDRFTERAKEHDTRMRTIARREFDQRTADLTKKYEQRTAKAEQMRGRKQGETIALLEKFLVDHPAHEQFTPDAMFRLADLY